MSELQNPQVRKNAYVITGPTSGVGYRTALELAEHGTLVLVGRSRDKLHEVQQTIRRRGGRAISVVCDLSDVASVRKAAEEILSFDVNFVGLLNNAGVQQPSSSRTAIGWDTTFATNHLGPFALTEALLPRLGDGANVLFLGSATEDSERKPARAAGFRGGRYISCELSARGKWEPGGSSREGQDAYATSKQCNIATALALSREVPRLRFNVVEPGFIPNSGLHRGVRGFAGFLLHYVLPLLTPFMKYWSTTTKAAHLITKIMTASATQTGTYYDERGQPMLGSPLVQDPVFQDRVVAETRAFLSTVK